jgi:2-isopropylmalate synthase
MLQELEIDLSALLLDRVELAACLRGRDRAMLLDRLRSMQQQGYDLASADGAVELAVREALHPYAHPFDISSFEVTTRCIPPRDSISAAIVSVKVGESVLTGQHTAKGPIEALDCALRDCLGPLYPDLTKVALSDYRVQPLEAHRGTAARVAVSISWTDGENDWTTMGVCEDIMESSWIALSSSVRLEVMRAGDQNADVFQLTDDSWAV